MESTGKKRGGKFRLVLVIETFIISIKSIMGKPVVFPISRFLYLFGFFCTLK